MDIVSTAAEFNKANDVVSPNHPMMASSHAVVFVSERKTTGSIFTIWTTKEKNAMSSNNNQRQRVVRLWP